MSQQQESAWQILVVAYNSESDLPRLIGSIEDRFPAGTTMAIWSNSDTTRLRSALTDAIDGSRLPIEVHGDGSNLGFAEGCNRLAALSHSETVLFVNPDTEILSFDGVLEPIDSRIVAPLIYSETGELQRTFGAERTLGREFSIRLLRREAPLQELNEPTASGFVSGAAFAVNRRRFLEMGGFDPTYFMYYEDLDFCRRWRASGGSIYVDPEFKLMHIGGASASRNMLLALQRSYTSALTYHSRSRISRLIFQGVALTEAVFKSVLGTPLGRVGRVDRRTQNAFTIYLLRGGVRGKVVH